MKRQEWFHAIWRFLKPVPLIDLGIFVAVGLVCWFGGWRSAFHYSNGLIIAGVGAMAIGVFSLFGGWGITRNFVYQHAQSAGENDVVAQARRELKDTDQSYEFLAVMGVVGVVVIACGILVRTIFAGP